MNRAIHRRPARLLATATAVGVLAILAACQGKDSTSTAAEINTVTPAPSDQARIAALTEEFIEPSSFALRPGEYLRSYFARQQAKHDVPAVLGDFDELADYLYNRMYVASSGTPVDATRYNVVTGLLTYVSLRDGWGGELSKYHDPGNTSGPAAGTYHDPTWRRRTAIGLIDTLGKYEPYGKPIDQTIWIDLEFYGSTDVVRKQIEDLKSDSHVIVVVDRDHRRPHEKAGTSPIYPIAGDGLLYGIVNTDDNSIGFPALGDFNETFVARTPTTDDLYQQSSEPLATFPATQSPNPQEDG